MVIVFYKKIFTTVIKISFVSLVLAMSLFQFNVLPARADALASVSDLMTRLADSTPSNTYSDHTIQFTLPAGINFDATGSEDQINIDFDDGFTRVVGFSVSDFTITDGTTTWNILNALQGAAPQTPDCTFATSEHVSIAFETDTDIFRFRACAGTGFTPSVDGATITITINGNGPSSGYYANPAAAGSKQIDIDVDDEGTAGVHSGALAVGIVPDDRVTVTATVDPFLTFDIDTTTVAMPGTETGAPYSVELGTLSASAIKTSNNSTVKSIYLDFQTNAASGGTVTVQDSNAGLASAATGHTISSSSGLLSAGTERYGICYSSVSNLDTYYPTYHTGNCTPTKHTVGALQTTPQNFIGTSGPNTPGRVEVLVKAAISNVTSAAPDYTDTLTFIATGTF